MAAAAASVVAAATWSAAVAATRYSGVSADEDDNPFNNYVYMLKAAEYPQLRMHEEISAQLGR